MSRTFKALSVAVVLCTLGVVVMAVSGALAAVAPISEDSHPVLPSLGVTTHLNGLTDAGRRVEFARLATMGTSWIRVGVPWYSVQPTERTVSASELGALDQIMAEATTAGMRVLFIGDQAPSWAGGGGATASMPAAYGSFMGVLAKHFRGRGLHGTSPAYEIMNEPDGRGENGQPRATPSDYAAAACSAFHAIKSQDRGTIVVTGALDVSDWEPWLRAAFQAGLGTCFDVLSAHPYAHLDVLDQIRAVAGAEGSPDVRIWVTEFGFSTCDDLQQSCVSEADQASLLVKRLEELRRYYPWVTVAMIYEDRDEPSNPGTPPERAFGLLKTTDNGAGVGAKPAVAAIEALYRGA